jgi:cold shock CspA family protein/ribosome-associated translation inhibitor RaiA
LYDLLPDVALIAHSSEKLGKTMQTPLQIDFQNMEASPAIRESIAQHVDTLETRYGRVTACRVVLKGPGGHHQSGGLYEVNIRLALPNGQEVNVGRTAQRDERHANLPFAINDAFKRARRRLQDHARKLQGQVKQHEGPPIGTVVRLDTAGEFGFLEAPDGREVYFHRNSVLNGGFARLTVGSRVTYAEERGEKGPQASTVRVLGKHGLRT